MHNKYQIVYLMHVYFLYALQVLIFLWLSAAHSTFSLVGIHINKKIFDHNLHAYIGSIQQVFI